MDLSDSALLISRLNSFAMASDLLPLNEKKSRSPAPLYASDSESGEVNAIIDSFSPRPYHADTFSPPSSNSSDSGCHSSNASSSPRSSRSAFESFFQTQSRVVRLFNLPRTAEGLVSALLLPPQSRFLGPVPRPVELWASKSDPNFSHPESLWAVYQTHEEASSALSLSGPVLSVTTALESDLHPLSLFRRFSLSTGAQTPAALRPLPSLRVSASYPHLPFLQSVSDRLPGMEYGDYTISSNPPNPKNSFRLGDWMCSSPKCAAHNFGRNLSCIGCGCPRSSSGTTPPQPSQPYSSSRVNPSPRFSAYQHSLPSPLPQSSFPQSQQYSPPSSSSHLQPQRSRAHSSHQASYPSTMPTPPKAAHPLLTPSGRAFTTGGKVQNISSDPLSPCIMWWPDNEPLPEQGQIRPGNLTGVQQPPILNTGNKGPITHQPGDWVCKKCNYLNWRRRKVCQTCLPYAEGNGDSISAAVQAERIHLLQTVLAQGQDRSSPLPIPHAPRSHSLTPPQPTPSLINSSPSLSSASQNFVHRSHSNVDLASRYASASPIYQTSGLQRQPSPLYSTGPSPASLSLEEPTPLLPSFLQDIVQSPSLSPTSSSSADFSLEEEFRDIDKDYDDISAKLNYALSLNGDKKQAMEESIANIWRLDGEESKSLGSFGLPIKQDFVRIGGDKHVRDIPRAQLITS